MLLAKFTPLLLAVAIASPGIAQDLTSAPQKIVKVHGYLDAHWEYPNFLPDNLPGYHALPFDVAPDETKRIEQRWRDEYWEPVWDAYKWRPSETICILIVGEGYVARRKPTTMWPADEQFIFTKVRKLKKMKSESECAVRMGRSGH